MVNRFFERNMKSLLYGMEVSHGFRRYMIFSIALIYFMYLGHSAIATTAMFAAARLAMILFEFPTGAFADHFSRKKAIIISFFLMSLSFFGMYTFTDFWILSVFFILGDIGWSFQSGSNTAWLIDELNYGRQKKKLSSMYARLMFFDKIGYIIGGLVGFILIAINFRLVWLFVAIIDLFTGIVVIKFMVEKRFKPKKTPDHFIIKTYKKMLDSINFFIHKKNRQIKGLAVSMFFGTISLNVFFILVPVVLLELLSIPENIISGILSGIGVLMLLAPFLGEKMVHKYSFKKSLISLFLIMTITIFIYAFSRSILLSILILMVFYTMDIAYSVIFASAMQHSIPTKIRATMGSAVNTIWASANAISAGLVALNLIFFGLVGTMIFAGVLALCNTFLLYVMLNDGD